MHAAAQSLVTDGLLSLLLGADEQDVAALCGHFLNVVVSLVQLLHGLLQVDDIDAVALGEDELCHLGVPTAGLVTEVHTCLEKLLHRNDCHDKNTSKILFCLRTLRSLNKRKVFACLFITASDGQGLPSTQYPGTKGHSDACVMLCNDSIKCGALQGSFA